MTNNVVRAALLFATCAAVLFFLTASPRTAIAQVSGATLSGLITDSSGAGIPNATVSIKNVGKGAVREVPTNGDGFYSTPNLLPGTYDVTVTAQGFSSVVQKGITLTVGAQQALNLSLKPGQVKELIEVISAPPDVQTTTSTISATVDSVTVRELPLNGRDWTSLAALEPGVSSIQNQVGTGFSANKGNRGFGNQLTNGGHRANENTYRINGVTINDYSNGAPGGASGLNLGVDGIQEFSVLTSDYTAEYGRTSGAVINAITKSGVNELHGTAFFFDRDKVFDARNYFDPATIPPFRRVQFGGSAGTAIVKDKTFVYGTYEGVRQNRPVSQTIKVPSDAERALAVAAVAPYMKLWPEAPAGTPIDSNGIQTFDVAFPSISNENYATGRVDQKIGKTDTLAGSYFWDSGPQSQEDPLLNTTHQVFSRRQMASVEETHTFSSALVNTIHGGISRVRGDINTPVSGTGAAVVSALAIAPGAAAPPQIGVSGASHITTAIGLGGLNRFLHRWTSGQVYDDAFLTHGTHSIKLGFAFERMRYNVTEKLSPNGRMNNYGSLADLLANTHDVLNALAPGGSHEVQIRESLVAGYLQDDWRARPNLTLNLGLRYEFTTLPVDAGNNIQEITTLANCATPGVAANTSSPCGPQHVGSFIAKNPTTKNFEPRIGFSWDPFKDSKTAVRGGFGLFDVLPLPYEFGLNTAATFPYQVIGNDKTPGCNPCGTTLGSGIDPNVTFIPNVVRNRFVQQDPKRALVMNWNFNIQREVAPNWTAIIGYVGSRSTHLSAAADDINLVPPVSTSAGILIPMSTYQIDPNWGGGNGNNVIAPGGPGGPGIRPVLFDAESTYHGLQAQLKKVMSSGLQGQVSYTYSKCDDTSSAPVTGDTYSTSVAVPLLLSKRYRVGACDFDLRHVAVGTVIWDVPGPKSGAASWIAGGWELGTIVTATSGSPFTVTVGSGNDPLNTGFNGDFSMDVPSLVAGCNPIHGGVNYLNAGCFTLPYAPIAFQAANCPVNDPVAKTGFYAAPVSPPSGMAFCQNLVGSAGRNHFYGPGLKTVDFSIFKNMKLMEKLKMQFRAEFFNILNHTNLASPNFLNDANNSVFDATGASIGSAGVIGSTSTSSRQIQLGLKLIF